MGDIFEDIKNAVLNFDKKEVTKLTAKAISTGMDPVDLFDNLKEVINKIGDDFSKGVLFLPHLVGAADAMEGGMPIIMSEIQRTGKTLKSLGTVVIGTVYGDIHSIGKTMVATLLAAEGFTVHDVGINVSAQDFVQAVEKNGADLIAMSALLTTTAPEQQKVIGLLKEKNLRSTVKVMVGGGAISHEFAEQIGADGYSGTAPGGVKLARKLINV